VPLRYIVLLLCREASILALDVRLAGSFC